MALRQQKGRKSEGWLNRGRRCRPNRCTEPLFYGYSVLTERSIEGSATTYIPRNMTPRSTALTPSTRPVTRRRDCCSATGASIPARTRLPRLIAFVAIALFGGASEAPGQLREHHIYHPENDFGSDAMFTPLQAFVNGSCDFLRDGYGTRSLLDRHYLNGMKNVNRVLASPLEVIRAYNRHEGKNFITDQVFPLRFGLSDMPWIPNYQSHLIGEGLVCRESAEWYDARDYRFPYTFAIITTLLFQYANEVTENGDFTGDTVDPIADMYIFNPLGYLLFYSDAVSEYFGTTLHYSRWDSQPVMSPTNLAIANAGRNFVIKHNVPRSDRWHFFYAFNVHGTLGMSYENAEKESYSFGAGVAAKRLKRMILKDVGGDLRPVSDIVPSSVMPNFAFFYDRNGSLLLSVSQVGIDGLHTIMNLYPGAAWDWPIGTYLSYNHDFGLHVGISFQVLPVGLFVGRAP